jgi:hypothetical protein
MVELNSTFEYNILTEHNLLFPLQCGVNISDIPPPDLFPLIVAHIHLS